METSGKRFVRHLRAFSAFLPMDYHDDDYFKLIFNETLLNYLFFRCTHFQWNWSSRFYWKQSGLSTSVNLSQVRHNLLTKQYNQFAPSGEKLLKSVNIVRCSLQDCVNISMKRVNISITFPVFVDLSFALKVSKICKINCTCNNVFHSFVYL